MKTSTKGLLSLGLALSSMITPAELGPALDRMFAALPAKAAPFTVPDVTPQGQGQTITIQRDYPQTAITMAEPGIKRDDPDWYAGQIVNYTLGGGGFQSRLMEDVRGAGSKKGLSYGFSSAFVPYQQAGLVMAGNPWTGADTVKLCWAVTAAR